ncbi:ABC transporter ATP-binding protein [Jiangella alkaliphila]|uniref:ABC-2 type transport system ATP-binding protein n=1 Tax=Jiangella alkaliphila TaxID=419479 RepID=A0A1H2L1X7_9ACTN|nr:ABC transporter ATP-binding protein [Jiangella alkaliphila]SDU74993.1 ABC-2 type transport system ATP-binding protein [Jiangella alkaliphila]
MSAAPAVEITSLVKRYDAVTAVDGLSLRVAAGTITAVLGPNGAGKTTTLEVCEGFRRPDAGTVRVLGLDPWRDGAELRPRVGVMLQEGAGFYPGARPEELLTHLARLHATPLDVPMLMVRLGLDRLGGKDREGRRGRGGTPLRRLSGGERQRVALAAALVGRPELVFLDEPTAGLDPQGRRDTWQLLDELRAAGVTVVLTTHLIDEAERLADHVVIIDAGRVLTEGTPQELISGVSDDVIRFGGPPRLDVGSLLAALPDNAVVREVAPGSYEVTATVDPRLLATLTSWCAANDILAEGLQVGHRSLEDVYLELIGAGRTAP